MGKKTRAGQKKNDTCGAERGGAPRHTPLAALLAQAGATSATSTTSAPPTPAAPPSASPPPPAATGPRFPHKVVVRREKKGRGGKTVTRISGLTAEVRAQLQGPMKKALGCGATLEGDDLVLLGALVDRAADYLERQGARRVVRAN